MLWSQFYLCVVYQDGAERVIESLSLIDAVMPDVVESRKQAATKSQQLNKPEAAPNNTNGEEGAAPSLSNHHSCSLVVLETVYCVM